MADRISNVVRRKFIDFFTNKHGHKFIPSSAVLPRGDKTLSFTNAGMNQFKSLFLADLQSYQPSRVCNYQRCIRVGGRMCDLDRIGKDFRHHTFFEMLGNWSFNDYGKAQACEWAMDFLVDHLEIDVNKLIFTYYATTDGIDDDLESKEIWRRLGVKEENILANVNGDNFWEMGDSGPCGRSTEIFYPLGEELVEIWNIVFIDRQRLPDSDQLVPLRSKFVDTGMGLERILAVLNGVESNYDTDLFKAHIAAIEAKSDVEPYSGFLSNELDVNYRILADHSRMIAVALADGVQPGRRGAAFDLRSVIKRCCLLSRDVFQQETPRYLLFDLVDETVESLANAYPHLQASVKSTRRVLASESKRYLRYLDSKID